MKPSKYLLALCLICLASVSLFAKMEDWDTFADKEAAEKTSRLAHIVIIRPAELKGTAINIYIDGEYVSSLLPGAYTEEFVCSGKHRVNLAYTDVTHRYREKRKGGEQIHFKSNKKHVYMLSKKGNKLIFSHFPENDIPKLLSQYTKKQTHTISRLNKRKCTQSSAVK